MRRSSRTLRRVTTRARWPGSGRWPSTCRWCLGSATPSLESWSAAQRGDYRLVEMPRRVSALPLPDVAMVDLRTQRHGRRARGSISQPLYQAVQEALRDGGQVILLLNRRGYSTTIQCPACGYVVKCPHCDIALTHHRQGEQGGLPLLRVRRSPRRPVVRSAGSRTFATPGWARRSWRWRSSPAFPGVPCLRMDSDSMAKPGSHEEALDRFRSRGSADPAGHADDRQGTRFSQRDAGGRHQRRHVAALSRLSRGGTDVSAGDAGGWPHRARRRGGRVLVQTFSPDHPAIVAAQRHDYVMFADRNCRCGTSSAIRP